MNPRSNRRLRTVPVLLGIFILWQLFFLFAANLLPLQKDLRQHLKKHEEEPDYDRTIRNIESVSPGWIKEKGHVHDATETSLGLTKRWGHLTGQTQSWSLFAPNVAENIVFPAIELSWDEDPLACAAVGRRLVPLAAAELIDGLCLVAAAGQAEPPSPYLPVKLLSDNEPANPQSYFKFGRFRLRRYESAICVAIHKGDKSAEESGEAWRQKIKDAVHEEWRAILAYLKWRVRLYQADHPERPPPRQAILWMRTYFVPAPPPPPGVWNGPEEVRVARWRPQVAREDADATFLPIEVYNPVMLRFESMEK